MYIEDFEFDTKEGKIVNLLERHDFWGSVQLCISELVCFWEACSQVGVLLLKCFI